MPELIAGQFGLTCAPCVDAAAVMALGALLAGAVAAGLALGIPAGIVGTAALGGIALGAGLRLGQRLASSPGDAAGGEFVDRATYVGLGYTGEYGEQLSEDYRFVDPVPEWVDIMVKGGDHEPALEDWRAGRVDEGLRGLSPQGEGAPVGRNEDTKAVNWSETMEQTEQLLNEVAEENRRKSMLGQSQPPSDTERR